MAACSQSLFPLGKRLVEELHKLPGVFLWLSSRAFTMPALFDHPHLSVRSNVVRIILHPAVSV